MIETKRKGTGIFAASAVAAALVFAVPASSYGADDLAAGVETLSLAELERQLQAQGIRVKEMEVEGLLAEIEGFDADGREIELKLDRRTGEILARKYDD